MKIVVVGSGGREHALGWKFATEARGRKLWFVPGNAGTACLGTNVPIEPDDLDAVSGFASGIEPDLVVVGPEEPLARGLGDRLAGLGLTVFGPTSACARIETSKVFAKNLMSRCSIPTAPYAVFTSASEAHEYVERSEKRLVVKADGLARGKGAIVAEDKAGAHRAVDLVLSDRIFGPSGEAVVIEERLTGEEASVLALTDGERYVVLPPAQDHKPVFDQDRGPNTGGMGAYSPCPLVGPEIVDRVEHGVIRPLLEGLRRDGLEYRGVIYAGLMINDDGVFVIEFNARFGDPEAQAILPTLDCNLAELLVQAAEGRLEASAKLRAGRWAVCVVLASGGYPDAYERGKAITGLDAASAAEGVVVFHSGTKEEGGRLITWGGRVLGVAATGESLGQARRRAYDASRKIRFDGMYMRTDIGLKGMDRLDRMGVRRN